MDHTATSRIGKTGLSIPILGLGTNPLGGLYEAVPPATVKAIIDRAWERGVRFFDLAPVYGYGAAEKNVGAALTDRPRDLYTLTTKVGRLLLSDEDAKGREDREDVMVIWQGTQLYKGTDPVKPYFDFTYDGVMRSFEASLERAGVDRFDAIHIHDPDLHPDEAIDGAFRTLSDLKSQGVIGAIGCGMNQWEMLAAFARRADFDCFLLAGRYSLLDQTALAELLPVCEERSISLIVGGVYNSGILSHSDPGSIRGVDAAPGAVASWKDNVTYNYIPAPPEVIARAAKIRAICDAHGTPMMAAAIQFPRHHPAVAAVLMGPRELAHVDSNVDMFNFPIPDALWADLKAEGILPRTAPTP
jgi:D-threo-aldose 1-dehydrogenase